MSIRINDLPIDAQSSIFAFLNIPDLLSVTKVCKAWSDVAKNDLIWMNHFEQVFAHAADNWRTRFQNIQTMLAFRDGDEILDPSFSRTSVVAFVNHWRPIPVEISRYDEGIEVACSIDREGSLTGNEDFTIFLRLQKIENYFFLRFPIKYKPLPIIEETELQYSIKPWLYVKNGARLNYIGSLDYRERTGEPLEDNLSSVTLPKYLSEKEQEHLLGKIRKLESRLNERLNSSIQKTVQHNLKCLSRFRDFEELGFSRARFLCDKKGNLNSDDNDLISVYFFPVYIPELGHYLVKWDFCRPSFQFQMTEKERAIIDSSLNKTAIALTKKFGVTITDLRSVERPGIFLRAITSVFRFRWAHNF